MNNRTDELKNRIEARKHELLAKYNELKADTRKEASDNATKLKTRLDEVEAYLKDGWDNLTDNVSEKLNRWLDKN